MSDNAYCSLWKSHDLVFKFHNELWVIVFFTSFPICRNLLSSTEQQCEELQEKQKEMLVKEEELRGEIVFRVSQKEEIV